MNLLKETIYETLEEIANFFISPCPPNENKNLASKQVPKSKYTFVSELADIPLD
jgi:hypothetical protein